MKLIYNDVNLCNMGKILIYPFLEVKPMNWHVGTWCRLTSDTAEYHISSGSVTFANPNTISRDRNTKKILGSSITAKAYQELTGKPGKVTNN